MAFIIGYLGSTLWQRIFVSELSASSATIIAGFEPLLQAPVKLQVMAILVQVQEAEFARLKELTGTSDSVMSKHLSALADANLIRLTKAKSESRQRTWASVTRIGRTIFHDHVAALQRIIGGTADD